MRPIENERKDKILREKLLNTPNILDSSGSADVNIKIIALLAIRWVSDVFLRCGRIFDMNGIV